MHLKICKSSYIHRGVGVVCTTPSDMFFGSYIRTQALGMGRMAVSSGGSMDSCIKSKPCRLLFPDLSGVIVSVSIHIPSRATAGLVLEWSGLDALDFCGSG